MHRGRIIGNADTALRGVALFSGVQVLLWSLGLFNKALPSLLPLWCVRGLVMISLCCLEDKIGDCCVSTAIPFGLIVLSIVLALGDILCGTSTASALPGKGK